MYKFSIIISLLFLSAFKGQAQQPILKVITSGTQTNLRGLSSRDGHTIWVSGSAGQVGLSMDSGQTFKWVSPRGYENRDFRDIADLGDGSAVVIGVDTPALILKTTDYGRHWQQVFYDPQPGMFLDAVDFSDPEHGLVVGDPISEYPFIATTDNGASHWQVQKHPALKSTVVKAEAFFAASGSNVITDSSGEYMLISGGLQSRFWQNGKAAENLPFCQGTPTAGPNGMDKRGNTIAIVGGDFTKPERGDSSFAISFDKGQTWQPYNRLPGYGSGISIISDSTLISCGLKGVWMSENGGKGWETIASQPFNACLYLSSYGRVFLAGPRGSIAVINGL